MSGNVFDQNCEKSKNRKLIPFHGREDQMGRDESMGTKPES